MLAYLASASARGAMPDRQWDVMIVNATVEPPECAHRLRDALTRLGLRVSLNLIPVPDGRATPAEILTQAKGAAFSVILMAGNNSADPKSTAVTYMAIPPPTKPGQAAVFAALGTVARAGAIETGQIEGDVQPLADRIAARVQAGG